MESIWTLTDHFDFIVAVGHQCGRRWCYSTRVEEWGRGVRIFEEKQ